jgi:hypothetical protein
MEERKKAATRRLPPLIVKLPEATDQNDNEFEKIQLRAGDSANEPSE